MTSKFYPNIELPHIQSVVTSVKLAKSDTDWLSESPYGGQIQELIQELADLLPIRVEEGAEGGDAKSISIDLVYETQKLYLDLTNTPIGTGKDALAYYRTVSVVLGRLLELTAKAEEISQYKAFKERVYSTFESILTPDQITDAMAYLRGERATLPTENE